MLTETNSCGGESADRIENADVEFQTLMGSDNGNKHIPVYQLPVNDEAVTGYGTGYDMLGGYLACLFLGCGMGRYGETKLYFDPQPVEAVAEGWRGFYEDVASFRIGNLLGGDPVAPLSFFAEQGVFEYPFLILIVDKGLCAWKVALLNNHEILLNRNRVRGNPFQYLRWKTVAHSSFPASVKEHCHYQVKATL